jgi:type I restriction enzyme S subunit
LKVEYHDNCSPLPQVRLTALLGAAPKNGLYKQQEHYGEGARMVHMNELFANRVIASQEMPRVTLSETEAEGFSASTGDILIARRSIKLEGVAKPAMIGETDDPLCFESSIIRLRPDTEIIDPEFLLVFFESEEGRRQVLRVTRQVAVSGIAGSDLKDIFVPILPIPEQRRVCEILRTWDEALEKLTALRSAKERRLGALRAALLFGRLRLKGLRHNWAPTRLEAVTHELTKRNSAKGLGRGSVMGVTKAEGVVPMREQTIAADISRYKRLPPRAFAYNPMRINVGSIAMNEREEAVLVSPDYVVFACNADVLDPDYLDHLRKTSWWAHYINSGGSGSVRQRTYYDDLAALKLPLPELDEQKAIAAVLNTARDDLAATEREIEALTRQKRGLMQKLLTGEWRAKLEAPVA